MEPLCLKKFFTPLGCKARETLSAPFDKCGYFLGFSFSFTVFVGSPSASIVSATSPGVRPALNIANAFPQYRERVLPVCSSLLFISPLSSPINFAGPSTLNVSLLLASGCTRPFLSTAFIAKCCKSIPSAFQFGFSAVTTISAGSPAVSLLDSPTTFPPVLATALSSPGS